MPFSQCRVTRLAILAAALLSLGACRTLPSKAVRVQASNAALSEAWLPGSSAQAKPILLSFRAQQPQAAAMLTRGFSKKLAKALRAKGYAPVSDPTEAQFQLALDFRYLGPQSSEQMGRVLKQGVRGNIQDPRLETQAQGEERASSQALCLVVDLRLRQKVGEYRETEKMATSRSNRGITEISTLQRVHWRQAQTRLLLVPASSLPALEQALFDTLIGIF